MSEKLIQLKNFYSGPEKWTQFTREDGLGARCILGGMDFVGIATDYNIEDDLDSLSIYSEFSVTEEDKIKYPRYTLGNLLANWNNAPERKFEDITALIDRAIARRELGGITTEVV